MLKVARERYVRVIAPPFPLDRNCAAPAPAAEMSTFDSFLQQRGVVEVIDLRDALREPRNFNDSVHVRQTGVANLLPLLEYGWATG
jgi:hypothetical protein